MGIESKLYDLQHFLDNQHERKELTEYSIDETFNGHNYSTYNVINMTLEIENNIVTMRDILGEISDHDLSVLNGFLISEDIDIVFSENSIDVIFKDGIVNIKVI